MLNELCQEINNYFDRGQPKFYGEIVIEGGVITNTEFTEKVLVGQYFRIIGSVLNDGVYCFNSELSLLDETFNGSIWLMAVPRTVVKLDNEIDEWIEKYGDNSVSPYQSESFGGYSYSKANGDSTSVTWQDVFAKRLNLYRRIRK